MQQSDERVVSDSVTVLQCNACGFLFIASITSPLMVGEVESKCPRCGSTDLQLKTGLKLDLHYRPADGEIQFLKASITPELKRIS